jgi:predicted DNA-binding transcriptional regulator YafY
MIDRIRAFEKTEIAYEIPDDFDFEEFQSKGFKVLGGEHEQEVVVRVHPLLRPQITEQTWHPTQQVAELENGWLRVRFRLAALDEIKTWIQGYAPYIIPEKPKELIKDIAEAFKESLNLLQQ